jgi:glycerol-3-phosphate acyltransferase PlsY
MEVFAVAALSYLIGSFSSAFVVGKVFMKIDIRNHGSGNAGATNAIRIMGKKLGILTFSLDFTKGLAAVLLGRFILGEMGGYLASIFAVIGHNWPIFFRFKGGKGIATTIASMAIVNFPITLISVIVGVLTAYFSKFVSLGSLVYLTLQFILAASGLVSFNLYLILLTLALAVLGFYRHKENIKRLVNGKENRIGR